MLAEVIRSALEDEALASGLSTRLNDMKARLKRLETRAGRKRQLALRAMSEAEIQKLPKRIYCFAEAGRADARGRRRGQSARCLLEAAAV